MIISPPYFYKKDVKKNMTFKSRYEKWLASLGLFNKKKIKNVNDLFNLEMLTQYWTNYLLEKCQTMFLWNGLPFPQREVENLLLLRGYCAFVKNDKFIVNEYAVVPCTYSGVTEYADIGTLCNWTTPIVSGYFDIQKTDNGIIIRNNSLTMSMCQLIQRYAILLANTDISLMCALVNDRSQSVLVADTENTANSINTMYKELEESGKRKAIVREKLFEALQGAASLPMINAKDTLRPICEVYDTILQLFYNDVGVRYNKDKKERMVESEVVSDSQRLLINITDMLNCRKEACKEINKMYGLNISVKLSNEFVSTNKVDKNENDNNNFSQLNSEKRGDDDDN